MTPAQLRMDAILSRIDRLADAADDEGLTGLSALLLGALVAQLAGRAERLAVLQAPLVAEITAEHALRN